MQACEAANRRHPSPSPHCGAFDGFEETAAATEAAGGRGHTLGATESLRPPASGSAGLTEERIPLGRAALQELHPRQGSPHEAAAAAPVPDRPSPAAGPPRRIAAEAPVAAAHAGGPGRRDVPPPAEPPPQPAGPAANAAPAEHHQSPQLGAGAAAGAEGGCTTGGGPVADPVGAGVAGFGSLAHVRQFALEACQAIDRVSRKRRDQGRAGVGNGKAPKLASVAAALRDDHRGLHTSHYKPPPTQQQQQQQQIEKQDAGGSPEADVPELQRGTPHEGGGQQQRRKSLLPDPSEEQPISPLLGIHTAWPRRGSIIPEPSEEQLCSQLHLRTPLLERPNGRQRRVSLLPEPLEERPSGSQFGDLPVGPAPDAASLNLQRWP